MECRILDKTRLFCRMLDTIPTNPTVVPYRLQALQLFPRSCGLPAGAWSAEYSIKQDYAAQVRAESHSAPLRVRGVQNTRYNTYKPYRWSLPFTNPTVVPTQLQTTTILHRYAWRMETRSACLRVREVQNTRYNTTILHRCERRLTRPP